MSLMIAKLITNMFFLPARNSLSKEIGSRKSANQPGNFDLDYVDVSDFTLVTDINIPPLTKDEIERLAANLPEMAEVMVHTLNSKLQTINRNYPYTMPDWLKVILTVTSTVIAIIVVVVVIYAMKSGYYLCGKHLQNNRKNKDINLDEFELKEISKPHNIPTSHPLMHRLTANSCHSLAQRQLPQLPNAIWDQPDSPLYITVQNTMWMSTIHTH